MAKSSKDWPKLRLPQERGEMTATDVVRFPEGAERDAAIERWSQSVWAAWREQHGAIAGLVNQAVTPEPRERRAE
jgi:hypothetical protein